MGNVSNERLLWSTIDTKPAPVVTHRGDHIVCKINGIEVPHGEFRWDITSPVYTDGSCMHVQDQRIAIAASAAVQIAEDGTTRCASMAVPQCFPRSAVVAEHGALLVAAKFVEPGDQIELGSDCKAVVDGHHQAPEARTRPSSVMGGFWALVGHSFSRIFKVSAHLTKAQAEQRGEAAHHASNELADFVAKESLPSFIAVDLETYLRQSKHDAADLFHATNALVLAANASPPMATLDRISKGSIRSIRARWHHEYI